MTVSGPCLDSRPFREFCLAVCSGASALGIDEAYLDEDEAANPLPLHVVFPRVREVTISGPLQPSTLDYLGNCALWPLLDTLYLDFCWVRRDAAEALVRFVRNRCRHPDANAAPLQIALRECNVVSWLPAQLTPVLRDRLSIKSPESWTEREEIEALAATATDDDDDDDDDDDSD
ncbi:hypothetical protein AURDEDRAFT_115868 [Auricularia subglabra TFB-10046 SS5]|nr:hypothetical protein AURDEDRAFT_115868 [Auricularia subglabra TFB-10046 SS5]